MLRLDPAFPPLWRSTTVLQFGARAIAVVDDPEPWQQRLIRELESGIPEAALDPVAVAFGAPERAADGFVRRIARVLLSEPGNARPVVLQMPDGFPRAHAQIVVRALECAGLIVEEATWFGAPEEAAPDAAPVVVLAHHIVEPRRSAALMAGDVAHVPLVFTGDTAEVGPLVVPGRSPCLACIAAHRRDADPAWPQLAAQLIGRRPPAVGDALAIEAAIVAARLISEGEQNPQRPSGRSLTLYENSLHRSMRAHRPHAMCQCRSLAGIETAGARGSLATMTERALAQPA